MSKQPENHPIRKIPMYRYGTREEVTPEDLTDHVFKVLSECYSDMYGYKVTFKYEGWDEYRNNTINKKKPMNNP